MSTSHTRQPAIPPKSPLRKASRTSAPITDDLDSRMLSRQTKHDDKEEDYSLRLKYDEPLYTEINIPLPSLPSKGTAPTSNSRASCSSSTKSSSTTSTSNSSSSSSSSTKPQTQASPRQRSRTLSTLLPFHHRSSSTPNASSSSKRSVPASASQPQPHGSKIASRETAAVMDLKAQQARGRGRNRARTLDALAVVPAVLVLSAELFTPGAGDVDGRKERGAGRDGRGGGGGARKDSGVGRWEDGIR